MEFHEEYIDMLNALNAIYKKISKGKEEITWNILGEHVGSGKSGKIEVEKSFNDLELPYRFTLLKRVVNDNK